MSLVGLHTRTFIGRDPGYGTLDWLTPLLETQFQHRGPLTIHTNMTIRDAHGELVKLPVSVLQDYDIALFAYFRGVNLKEVVDIRKEDYAYIAQETTMMYLLKFYARVNVLDARKLGDRDILPIQKTRTSFANDCAFHASEKFLEHLVTAYSVGDLNRTAVVRALTMIGFSNLAFVYEASIITTPRGRVIQTILSDTFKQEIYQICTTRKHGFSLAVLTWTIYSLAMDHDTWKYATLMARHIGPAISISRVTKHHTTRYHVEAFQKLAELQVNRGVLAERPIVVPLLKEIGLREFAAIAPVIDVNLMDEFNGLVRTLGANDIIEISKSNWYIHHFTFPLLEYCSSAAYLFIAEVSAAHVEHSSVYIREFDPTVYHSLPHIPIYHYAMAAALLTNSISDVSRLIGYHFTVAEFTSDHTKELYSQVEITETSALDLLLSNISSTDDANGALALAVRNWSPSLCGGVLAYSKRTKSLATYNNLLTTAIGHNELFLIDCIDHHDNYSVFLIDCGKMWNTVAPLDIIANYIRVREFGKFMVLVVDYTTGEYPTSLFIEMFRILHRLEFVPSPGDVRQMFKLRDIPYYRRTFDDETRLFLRDTLHNFDVIGTSEDVLELARDVAIFIEHGTISARIARGDLHWLPA